VILLVFASQGFLLLVSRPAVNLSYLNLVSNTRSTSWNLICKADFRIRKQSKYLIFRMRVFESKVRCQNNNKLFGEDI